MVLRRFLFMLLLILAASGCGQSATGDSSEALTVEYLGIAEPGFIDQTVTLLPSGDEALVPTITYEPLDADGNRISDVEVSTAFGSDRGLLVVPSLGFFDVLAFSGNDVSQVVDVRATIQTLEQVEDSGTPTIEDPQPVFDGADVTKFGVFNELRFRNNSGAHVSLRVVCLVYDFPAPGRSQQAEEITEVCLPSRSRCQSGAIGSRGSGFREAQRTPGLWL